VAVVALTFQETS